MDDDLLTPWDDPDDEYEVLTGLMVPAAQADFERALQDWNALDTKAFGLLALVAAVIAGLATFHNALHPLWWLAASGCAASGAFLIAAIWPRGVDLGPDLLDFHEEMRERTPLDAARSMATSYTVATAGAALALESKSLLYWIALSILSLSLLACLPIIVAGP